MQLLSLTRDGFLAVQSAILRSIRVMLSRIKCASAAHVYTSRLWRFG